MTNEGTCVQASGNNGEDADTDSDADADADADADSDADSDADGDSDIDLDSGLSDVPAVLGCPAEWDSADITVSSMSVSDNRLQLGVGYTGGCTNHFVDVCWNREFSDDSPPEVQLFIMHNDQGDTCNDPVTEDLSYNITTLLDVWWTETGTGTGTVVLKLENREATWSF